MGRLNSNFQAANCEILLILGEPVGKARRYSEILHLPFPVLADPERGIYHLYGLERAIFSIQRTATVVIDRRGIIRYLKRVTDANTWLVESRELLHFIGSLSADDLGTGA